MSSPYKSPYKSPSKQYYDPDRVASEQKDIVVSQLKKENFELKQLIGDHTARLKYNDLELQHN